MTLLRSNLPLGALPPNPWDLPLFSRQNGCVFDYVEGNGCGPSPAFPAAEPVARVASQHCPIPSDSGRISINRTASRLNQKAANGDYPLNSVSHVWGALHISPYLHAAVSRVRYRVCIITPGRNVFASFEQKRNITYRCSFRSAFAP